MPGPPHEIATVRGIYDDFARGQSEADIAARLNRRGILTDLGRPWTRGTVHQILINEKYIGNNVWNCGSFKLKQRRVRNTPDLWVRSDGAFPPIVERHLFDAAQEIIRARSQRLTDDQFLQVLRNLLDNKGLLSGLIIDEAPGAPSSSAYQNRFGSLLRAYQLIGYSPDRDYRYVEINRSLRRLHPDVVAEVIDGIERAGGHVSKDSTSDLITVNREFSVSIAVVRCRETPSGSVRWMVRLDRSLFPDVTIAVRMNRGNTAARDYLILPTINMENTVMRVAEYNGLSLDAYMFDSLDPLFEMAGRVSIREVA